MTINNTWPNLKYEDWANTLDTLHLWTQIVGKLKLSHMPWINHSWHSTFFIGSRGFVSSGIPFGPDKKFETNFDLIAHTLTILTSDGGQETFSLESESVEEFWSHFSNSVHRLGIEANFSHLPNERPDAIPFEQDTVHCTYEQKHVGQFWQILLGADNILQKFRSRYVGKCSPVHFFWGSFDLACSRFSGRRAPEHPGGIPHLPDPITKEAYSHEVSSCGFWPGNVMYPHAAFYSYCYPEPEGFSSAKLGIDGAFYHPELREFIFPYEKAIQSSAIDQVIFNFFQQGYEAAANLAGWDRPQLENSSYLTALQTQDDRI